MASIRTILRERHKTHGDYSDVTASAQALKSVMRQGRNWPNLSDDKKEALEMLATKIARVLSGNPDEPEHWRDVAGYATLAAERCTIDEIQ